MSIKTNIVNPVKKDITFTMSKVNFFVGYMDVLNEVPFNYDINFVSYERGRQFAILMDKKKIKHHIDLLEPVFIRSMKKFCKEKIIT